jgi:DNA-binding GntR family transcriptional regulator
LELAKINTNVDNRVRIYTKSVNTARVTATNAVEKAMPQSVVDRVHRELRGMAMTFRFLPGERINEAILAKELGVSRTPLREALNRLSTEGFLTFSANNGFFRKSLDVKEIFDLYEFRMLLERSAINLAVERATDDQLAEMEKFSTESAREEPGRSIDDLVTLDEQFHEMLMKLTGNTQMLNSLRNINARIQFVRWLDMTERRSQTQSQHKLIVSALRNRDRRECERLITDHITRRLDQIFDKVERSYGRIFVRNQQASWSHDLDNKGQPAATAQVAPSQPPAAAKTKSSRRPSLAKSAKSVRSRAT